MPLSKIQLQEHITHVSEVVVKLKKKKKNVSMQRADHDTFHLTFSLGTLSPQVQRLSILSPCTEY